MRVLVVEDEEAISGPLAQGLRREGFDVDVAGCAADALEAAAVDVVLLDLRLPDGDGLDVCRALRARSGVPIIIVSARGDEVDRIVGLELGADDYIVKPFGFRELVARIRAVTRRGRETTAERSHLVVGPLTIDVRAHHTTLAGQPIDLTPREFELLAFLAGAPGVALTRQRILAEVWDTTWQGSTKTLDAHVASLRRKLADAAWIETVRGVGFRLREPA